MKRHTVRLACPPRRRVRSSAALALALAVAWGLTACGGASATRRGPLTYPERVAARAQAASELRVFQVRHNPTPCACPPWELLLGGHWQRADLTSNGGDEEDPVATMLAQAQDSPTRRWVVQGELDDDVSQCARGAQVVALRVTALGAPDQGTDGALPGGAGGAPTQPAPASPPEPSAAPAPGSPP